MHFFWFGVSFISDMVYFLFLIWWFFYFWFGDSFISDFVILLFLIWSISYFRFCWDAACTTNLSSNWTAGQRSYFIRGYLWNKTSWANNFEIISKRQVWQKKVRILSSADELFAASPVTLLWNVMMNFSRSTKGSWNWKI